MLMRISSTPGQVALLLLASVQILHAQNQPATPGQLSPANIEAGKLFQSQKWVEAVAAYEAITKAEPGNGQAWYRLGASLSALNKHAEAVAPLVKAVEILKGPMAMYMLGSTYARLGEKEKALAALSEAAGAGFAQPARLQNDPSLAGLREDPRYQKIVETVGRTSRPCMFSEKAREFDFWVGEWDVQSNGTTVGTNVIQRIEEGCGILENWKGQGGLSGKGINFFNPTLGTWRQTYVSSNAVIWEMTGEYKDGAMRYTGQVFSPTGTKMTRVTFYNLEPGRVRHTEDHSTDGGKTWSNVWDVMYIRKATASQ